ncbi:hypothetical protein U9M48_028852 [Paspalum notatum var. saurae]|uniref:SET domain-containing protein n=1 Tax=Paspalum notatum var. saurae TaxID=547442 RepID=A0AAQ3X0L3_PASNO
MVAPEEDHHQPSTSLVIYGGPCHVDIDTDVPCIKRPRTDSNNFEASRSVDPQLCPSASVTAHKRARLMMDEDFQHAVFLREPKPEPDMDVAPSFHFMIPKQIQQCSSDHTAAMDNIGIRSAVEYTKEAPCLHTVIASSTTEYNAKLNIFSNGRDLQSESMMGGVPLVEPIACMSKGGSVEESLVLETSEGGQANSMVAQHLALSHLKPTHDASDVSKGEEKKASINISAARIDGKDYCDDCFEKHHKFFCEYCPLKRSRNETPREPCRGHRVRKFIKECWSKCGCSMQCGNRVVQRGIACNLQVFSTQEGKGWGLRTLDELPKGAFVCEYVGELLTVTEVHERTTQNERNARYRHPIVLDDDWGSEGVLKDEEALCLDATFYGNVGRFINHRCYDANLIEIPVEVETPDHHYYHVAFFTSKKVEAFEELTWDYGIDFDDDKDPDRAFQCLCGSRYCRGRKHLSMEQKKSFSEMSCGLKDKGLMTA